MILTRVGSRIEPQFDPTWPELDRLHWHAAHATLHTGLPITVGLHYVVDKPGNPRSAYYVLTCGSTTYTNLPAANVCLLLTGISTGHREARRGNNGG